MGTPSVSGADEGGGFLGPKLHAPRRAPVLAVVSDQIEQRLVESDVMAHPFRLEPLVSQNLIPFSEKFPVDGRLLNEFAGTHGN